MSFLTVRFSDAEHQIEVYPIASDLVHNFDWQFIREPISPDQICQAICTCAILIGRLTGSSGDVYAASDLLGNAAHAKNHKEISRWAAVQVGWEDVPLRKGNRLAICQRVAYRLAQFFD